MRCISRRTGKTFKPPVPCSFAAFGITSLACLVSTDLTELDERKQGQKVEFVQLMP